MADHKLNEKSMAQEIQKAMKTEWPNFMDQGTSMPEPSREMKLLFVSISKGVIAHLQKNPKAFKVEAKVIGPNATGQVSEIE